MVNLSAVNWLHNLSLQEIITRRNIVKCGMLPQMRQTVAITSMRQFTTLQSPIPHLFVNPMRSEILNVLVIQIAYLTFQVKRANRFCVCMAKNKELKHHAPDSIHWVFKCGICERRWKYVHITIVLSIMTTFLI